MESHCLSFREIPHTTALFADYLYDFARVAQFYAHDPFAPESYAAAAQRAAELDPARRTAVADVLAEQNGLFGGGAETQHNIARLRAGQVLAVVTGQQAGLFGGPAYSVYKALTAIRLAEKLTGEGTPAVPVFWLASEDHDFAEVNHADFLDGGGQLFTVQDASAPAADTPVGKITLDGSIETLRAQVKKLWPRESAQEPEALLASYAPGRSYAHAFARLFQRLFAGRGLVLLDPLHPTLHALSRPLFRRALEEAESLRALVRERDRVLDHAGYHAQVRLRENATLLFLTVDGHRLPLRRRNNGFLLPRQGEKSLATLLELLEAEPERFSPNVLLRSLVQDTLLPTVAYVGGPAEVAYFAQSSALYERLSVPMPVIVPRVSATLVDRKVQRLLRKYRLNLTDCFRGHPSVRAQLAERHLPARLRRRLETTEARIERLLASTAQEVGKLDSTLEGAADTSRRKMLYQFHKLRGKAARAQASREEIVDRHLNILFNHLYPHRALQERRVNFLSFVARQGEGVMERLLEQLHLPCRDHQVIFL